MAHLPDHVGEVAVHPGTEPCCGGPLGLKLRQDAVRLVCLPGQLTPKMDNALTQRVLLRCDGMLTAQHGAERE